MQNKEKRIQDIQEIMRNSVQHHMISDVEVGAFLSSGVDSSYLVSLAKTDKTYTVGRSEERRVGKECKA